MLPMLDAPLIVNGRNRRLEHTQVIGALSIKCMFHGRAIYRVESSDITVDDTRYLILNHAQPYDLWIEADQPVESFCVFFPRAWSSDVFRNRILPDEALLENPYDCTQALLFYELPQVHDALLSPLLFELRRCYQKNEKIPGERETLFYRLLSHMVVVQTGLQQRANTFPGVRASTRQELYRRFHLTLEYLHTHLDQTLSLEDLARVALMSPFHFLRRFTEAFGMTPHAYLTDKRLKRAESMLLQSDSSVTEIGLAVGFQSTGSFSKLFRRHYGASPRMFRQNARST